MLSNASTPPPLAARCVDDAAPPQPATIPPAVTIEGNTEPQRQTPMWGRGRIDHFGLHAASPDAFDTIRTRLMNEGASDGTINDFGSAHSVFFRDPDGLEGEVLLTKLRV